jgi:hypothetical protein
MSRKILKNYKLDKGEIYNNDLWGRYFRNNSQMRKLLVF